MTVLAWQSFGPDRSDATAVTFVLVHDWASDGRRDWVAPAVTDRLDVAGHPALVVDLPGHAGSAGVPLPERREPAAWTAEAVEADLDRLRPGPVLAVGVGLGGIVAAHLAVRDRHPVVGLGLVAFDDTPGGSRGAEIAAALRDPSARVWHADVVEWVAAARDGRHDKAVLADWIERAKLPAAPRLGALRAPTVLAVGSDDPNRPRLPGLARLLHDAHLVTAPGDRRAVLAAPALTAALVDVAAGAAPRD